MQHALAERVDRLDLEPARGVQRVGEQAPRPIQQGASHAPRVAVAHQFRELSAKRFLGQHSPFSQAAVNTLDHLRRAHGRVGQAKDAARRDPRKEKAHDAQGQNMRLARAGIGRDPRRVAGIGGERLPRDRLIEHVDPGGRTPRAAPAKGLAHRLDRVPSPRHSSPSSSSPSMPHSRTRARWSKSPSIAPARMGIKRDA